MHAKYTGHKDGYYAIEQHSVSVNKILTGLSNQEEHASNVWNLNLAAATVAH